MNNKTLDTTINILTDALCEMDRGVTDWDTIYDMVEKAVNKLKTIQKRTKND